jgi:hypothetical protein
MMRMCITPFCPSRLLTLRHNRWIVISFVARCVPAPGRRWGAYASDPDEVGLILSMACLAMLEVCESTGEMLSNAEAVIEV